MPAVPVVFFQSMGCVPFMMQPAENRHSCSAEPLLLSTNRNKAVRPERRSTGHVCAPQSFLVTGSGYLISIRKEMLLIQSAAVSSLDQAAAGLLQFLSAFWNITVLPLLTDLRVRLQVFCSGLPQNTRVLLDLSLLVILGTPVLTRIIRHGHQKARRRTRQPSHAKNHYTPCRTGRKKGKGKFRPQYSRRNAGCLYDGPRVTDAECRKRIRRAWHTSPFSPEHFLTHDLAAGKYGIPGVYVIHNLRRDMYYVGQGKSVARRLNQHFTGSGNGDVYADYRNGDRFEIQVIPLYKSGYRNLNDLEREAIAAYSAYWSGYNKTRGNA